VTGDRVFQKVKQLSGGERNRTALAMLAASDANVLVLDEPTNHLDLWARGALERTLKQFNGTVLFVTHDRYFLDRVADHLLVAQPDQFRIIGGNYATYRHLVKVGLAAEARGDARRNDRDNKPKQQIQRSPSKPPRRKRQFPYRKVEELEAEIAEFEDRIQQLHQDLTRPEFLRDGDRVKRTRVELEELQAKLASLYAHWAEACELN
jgi:ATP-binding cassette subfamily F protein 3